MNTTQLLQQLASEVKEQNGKAGKLTGLDEKNLQNSAGTGKWNALQCVEHLNSYAKHYLPAFENAIERSIAKGHLIVGEVKSTWLGKKCINTVLATNSKKIKTPKRHNPIEKNLDKGVIDEFMKHQQRLESILEKAAAVNLAKTKVRIEIAPILKLHLGDFLQFFIYHQTRHLAQAERCLQKA